MKRMSEVFEFPVQENQVYVSTNLIGRGKMDDVGVRDVLTHAAHAINHVDALADALQFLLDEYIALANSGDAGNWSAEKTPEGMKAIAALAAYRGGK